MGNSGTARIIQSAVQAGGSKDAWLKGVKRDRAGQFQCGCEPLRCVGWQIQGFAPPWSDLLTPRRYRGGVEQSPA